MHYYKENAASAIQFVLFDPPNMGNWTTPDNYLEDMSVM